MNRVILIGLVAVINLVVGFAIGMAWKAWLRKQRITRLGEPQQK